MKILFSMSFSIAFHAAHGLTEIYILSITLESHKPIETFQMVSNMCG